MPKMESGLNERKEVKQEGRVEMCCVISVYVTWISYFWFGKCYVHVLQSDHYHTLLMHISWFQTFAMFWMLYFFFWVIPRHLNFMCRRCGTVCALSS